MAHVVEFLFAVAFCVLAIPSLNKWLSMWPVISDIVVMASFHNTLRETLRYVAELEFDADLPDWEDLSDGERLGQPSKESWHKQARRRAVKTLRWVQDQCTLPKLLLHLLATGPVMRLHYTLFKFAQTAPVGEQKSYLYNLCDHGGSAKASVAQKVLEEFTGLLSSDRGWEPLRGLLGPMEHWKHSFRECCRTSVLSIYAQVWRRMVHYFLAWPWCLVPVADPAVPRQRKLDIAFQLFQTPPSALDVAVSLKVRKEVEREVGEDAPDSVKAEVLLGTFWQAFLYHSFNQVVVSIAFLECLFAHFRQWIIRSPKPISVPLLQAKHESSGFKRACDRKRNLPVVDHSESPVKRLRTKTGRPAWIFKRGELGRRTARHIFIGEVVEKRDARTSSVEAFKQGVQRWRRRTEDEKKDASAKASARNTIAKQVKKDQLLDINRLDVCAPSPWGVGQGSAEYPLPVAEISKLQAKPRGISEVAKQWQCGGRRVLDELTIPALDYLEVPSSRFVGFDELQRAKVEVLISHFVEIFAPRGIPSSRRPPLVIHDTVANVSVLVELLSNLKSSPFRAEFALYTCGIRSEPWVDGVLEAPCHAALSCLASSCGGAAQHLPLMTESDLAEQLVDHGPGPWRFHEVVLAQARSSKLLEIEVHEVSEVIDMDALRESNKELRRSLKALKLLKRAQEPWEQSEVRDRQASRRSQLQRRRKGCKVSDVSAACGSKDVPELHSKHHKPTKKHVESSEDTDDASESTESSFEELLKADAAAAKAGEKAKELPPPSPTPSPPPAIDEECSHALPPRPSPPPAIDEEGGHALPPPPPLPSIGVHQELDTIKVGKYGFIKIDRKRQLLNAHCASLGAPGMKDHRTPTCTQCRMNRKATKAPLGLLVAWLFIGEVFDSREEHKECTAILYPDKRRDAREWLRQQPDCSVLLKFEAECLGKPLSEVVEPACIT